MGKQTRIAVPFPPWTLRDYLYRKLWIPIKIKFFNALTRNAMPLFLKGGDVIGLGPLLFGKYEPNFTTLAEHLSKSGYKDFFIDIGANIGITTYQLHDLFNSVYCFEPHPVAFQILKANLHVISKDKIRLFNYGISDADGAGKLMSPLRNLGGSFIADQGNSYDSLTLKLKEGLTAQDEPSYTSVDVRMVKGRDIFAEIFSGLIEKNFSAGMIKIDVEGYESVVLTELAAALPNHFQVAVYFENWDVNMTERDVAKIFGGKGVLYKVETKYATTTKLNKFLQGYFRKESRVALQKNYSNSVGDLVYFNN